MYCATFFLQTLYTYPNNFRAFKVLIAAQYSGAEINVVSEPPDFVLGETNKTSQFLENFPLGKVPAFITADGNAIYESNAIASYGMFMVVYAGGIGQLRYWVQCVLSSDLGIIVLHGSS